MSATSTSTPSAASSPASRPAARKPAAAPPTPPPPPPPPGAATSPRAGRARALGGAHLRGRGRVRREEHAARRRVRARGDRAREAEVPRDRPLDASLAILSPQRTHRHVPPAAQRRDRGDARGDRVPTGRQLHSQRVTAARALGREARVPPRERAPRGCWSRAPRGSRCRSRRTRRPARARELARGSSRRRARARAERGGRRVPTPRAARSTRAPWTTCSVTRCATTWLSVANRPVRREHERRVRVPSDACVAAKSRVKAASVVTVHSRRSTLSFRARRPFRR